MQAIRDMEPAWEKICGLKFELTSRTIVQPNGGTREILFWHGLHGFLQKEWMIDNWLKWSWSKWSFSILNI
jgi:hypothetical protein